MIPLLGQIFELSFCGPLGLPLILFELQFLKLHFPFSGFCFLLLGFRKSTERFRVNVLTVKFFRGRIIRRHREMILLVDGALVLYIEVSEVVVPKAG